MVQITSIYDLLSLIVIFADLYLIYKLDIIAIIGNMLALIIHGIIKIFTTNLKPYSIFKRPNGAKNCGIVNSGGLSDHESGFPSGHMSSISFTMLYLLMKTSNFNFTNIILYNIPIILVGIARYFKPCHNFIQIIAGYILGSSIALLFTCKKFIKFITPYLHV